MQKAITGRLARFMIACVLLMGLSACTGSDHMLPQLTDADLAKVNKEMSAKRAPLPTYGRSDGYYRSAATRITNRLLRNARPLCDYTGYKRCFFQTVYNGGSTINAFASDNYKVTVYRGLLEYMKSEEEIAAVIAHEMGHHLANHNAEKRQNAVAGAVISGVLTAVIVGASHHGGYYSPSQQRHDQDLVRDMTVAGAAMGALVYSREEEQEADLLGQYLLARAGYDLKKSEGAFQTLMRIKGTHTGGGGPIRASFWDTHPAGPERIAAWRKVAEEIRHNPSKLPYKKTRSAPRPTEAIAENKRPAPQKDEKPEPVRVSSKGPSPSPSSGSSGMECMFSWQTAKDGTRCGKRALGTKETKKTAFTE